MSTFIVPTRDDLAAYDESIALAGAVFSLRFRHNDREGTWYMDLIDESGSPLREGLKVVPNWPLFRTFMDRTRPAGELVAVDARIPPAPPGLEELGPQVPLAFVES